MLFHHFSIEKLTFYLFSVKEQQELDFQSSEKNFLFYQARSNQPPPVMVRLDFCQSQNTQFIALRLISARGSEQSFELLGLEAKINRPNN